VSPIPSIGLPPSQLLMARLLKTALPISTNKLVPKIPSGIHDKI